MGLGHYTLLGHYALERISYAPLHATCALSSPSIATMCGSSYFVADFGICTLWIGAGHSQYVVRSQRIDSFDPLVT
jgi:hypothetical protein